MRDRLSLPPSSDYRLSETDACYLLRACAVTAHDCCARTATKVVADIGGELFTIVELARPTIADALFETVRAARRLAVWKSTTGIPTKLRNSLARPHRSRFG